jgi:FAD binding domain
MIWRGAVEWPVVADGRTVGGGGNDAKLVIYPIHLDPATPDVRLTNWAVKARLGHGSQPPPRREDWNRSGRLDEALPFMRDRLRLDFVDPAAPIKATGPFCEFPCCDRDPLPRWSFGPETLLGDAAHPMYPTGGNGASQAILDARSLTDHLASGVPVADALAAYDAERRPATAAIVLSNRPGGPEGVIDLVEVRAPDGFDGLEAVASYAEREAIVSGYARWPGDCVGGIRLLRAVRSGEGGSRRSCLVAARPRAAGRDAIRWCRVSARRYLLPRRESNSALDPLAQLRPAAVSAEEIARPRAKNVPGANPANTTLHAKKRAGRESARKLVGYVIIALALQLVGSTMGAGPSDGCAGKPHHRGWGIASMARAAARWARFS